MAAQNTQWIKIDECITAYMDEAELSQSKYFKLWQLAFRGMTELGLDFFYTIKSVKLPVSANLTVPLPADYLNYSKVGVLNMQGEIITMGYNSNLTTAFDLQPTRLQQTQDPTLVTIENNTGVNNGVGWYNYWNGYALGVQYGLPSGTPFIGNFKIDNANNVIVLSENFPYSYIMLEYVASPDVNNEYVIPIQFKEALISYIRWKDSISVNVKTHVANSNIQMRRRDFYNDRRIAIARYDPFDIGDAYEWLLENQRLSVKS